MAKSCPIVMNIWALGALLCLAATAICTADESTGLGGRVLLLRNGNVLKGNIIPAGDRYLVGTANGGQISVPTSDVEAVFPSVAEVYQNKLAKVSPIDSSARLALAEWCLRQGLTSQAADQLLVAFTLEPNNRRIAAIEQRLLLEAGKADRPATPSPLPTAAARLDRDDRVKELPQESVERFVSSVQPFLMQRCGNNACHSVTSTTDYRLVRPKTGETLAARFTRRNLNETLKFVDLRNPEASRLLVVPQQPHANVPGLLLIGDRHYKNLLDWVEQLAGAPPTNRAELTARERPASRAPIRLDSKVRPASFAEEVDDAPRTQPSSSNANRPNGEGQRGVKPADNTPPDPLDPEAFNSRYLSPP